LYSQFPPVFQEPGASSLTGDVVLTLRIRNERGESVTAPDYSMPGSYPVSDAVTSSKDAEGQKTPLTREKRRKLSDTDAVWVDESSDSEPVTYDIAKPTSADFKHSLPIRQRTGSTQSDGYAPTSGEDAVFQIYAAEKSSAYGRVFDIGILLAEVTQYIRSLAFEMLHPATDEFTTDPLRVKLTETLTCLDDDEWKYLPLWAGGNDDGTGGVFEEDVPFPVAFGFSAPGPEVHCGSAAPSESSLVDVGSRTTSVPSSASEINFTDSTTTYPSIAVEDGFSDALNRHRVYDADSVFGGMTDDDEDCMAKGVTNNTEGKGKEKANGKFMIEAGADVEVRTEIDMRADYSDGVNSDDYDMDDPRWMATEQEGFGSDFEVNDGDGEMEHNDDGEDSDTTII
jgi:hypothetical protein